MTDFSCHSQNLVSYRILRYWTQNRYMTDTFHKTTISPWPWYIDWKVLLYIIIEEVKKSEVIDDHVEPGR